MSGVIVSDEFGNTTDLGAQADPQSGRLSLLVTTADSGSGFLTYTDEFGQDYRIAVSDIGGGRKALRVVLVGGGGGDGGTGADGKSAYQIAVENGFQGTVTQWLASLVGPQGATGPSGSLEDPGDLVAIFEDNL